MPAVENIFAIKDQDRLLVHLATFNWDFSRFGPVFLVVGESRIKCKYTAFGNHQCSPVLTLCLDDSEFSNVSEVARLFIECGAAELLPR